MTAIRKYLLWFLLAAAALAVVGGAGYLGYQRSRASAAAAIAPPPTVAVSRGPVVLSVTAPGIVVDTGSQTIAAPVSGRVIALDVLPGQPIAQGQVLAQLGDRSAFEAAVAQARWQVLQAQQTLDQLEAGAPQAAA